MGEHGQVLPAFNELFILRSQNLFKVSGELGTAHDIILSVERQLYKAALYESEDDSLLGDSMKIVSTFSICLSLASTQVALADPATPQVPLSGCEATAQLACGKPMMAACQAAAQEVQNAARDSGLPSFSSCDLLSSDPETGDQGTVYHLNLKCGASTVHYDASSKMQNSECMTSLNKTGFIHRH